MSNPTVSRLLNYIGPTDDYFSILWTLRLSPILSLLCLLLAETAWKSGFGHGLCFGLAAGQMFTVCLTSFRIKGVTVRNPDDSGIQQLHLTR